MTEYIEREDAIKVFCMDCHYDPICDECPTRSRLKAVPAADVEPVVRAKWEINCDGYYPYCSNCKREPQGRVMTDYCPNCGAKMKEG